jgi:hypothetical protein
VSDGWPSDHPAKLVGVKLIHEVPAVQVAAGHVHHSLVATIDRPNVETLLGLSAAADHIPLVIQRADGACTTHPEQHRYAPSATARTFGETSVVTALGLLYSHGMLKKMRFPMRSEQLMAHSRFDRFDASYAVFGNPIQDWDLHPMLENPAAFAAFAAVFPELSKLVVDGVPQVENYTVKHVVSVPASNQMPHQAIHADSPSPYPRAITVRGVTLSSRENSDFSAMYASGIILSKTNVESLAISTGEGNAKTKRANRTIGGDVCSRVREPGFVTTGTEYVTGGRVAPASLVPAIDPAACGCPICTAHAKWVTAHTPQGLLQQRELKEHVQQRQRQVLLLQQRELKEHEQQQRELKEQERVRLLQERRAKWEEQQREWPLQPREWHQQQRELKERELKERELKVRLERQLVVQP